MLNGLSDTTRSFDGSFGGNGYSGSFTGHGTRFNSGYGGYLGLAQGDKSAEQNYANLTRAQYADWMQRFLPKQKQLLSLATDESLAKEQLGRVDDNLQHSFATAQQGEENRLGRMGVSPQQEGNTSGLRQALATAGIKNATREQEAQRQMSILTGADGGTRQKLQSVGAGQ